MKNHKEDEHAEKVWELTLPQIRRKRSQRDNRRKALVAAATACVAFGAYQMSRTDTPEQAVALPPAEVVVEPDQTIAVIRLGSDGNAVLEEMSASNLSYGDMTFGLTQVVFEDPMGLEVNFHADSPIFQ